MWAAGTMQCCQQMITFRKEKYILIVCLVLVVLTSLASGSIQSNQKCGFGLQTPGVTIPKGDISIQHGKPLEIFCMLYENNDAGYNASHLFFTNNSEPVSSEYMTIVNKTTLHLLIPHPSPSFSIYSCKARKPFKGTGKKQSEGVCLNTVYVGVPPQDVINFTCISRNWQNMTCKWDVPNNYVPTTYKLYSYFGAGGRRSGCPNNTDVKHNYCFWNPGSYPLYRLTQEYYVLIIEAENRFGKTTFNHTIFHWAYVIPAIPDNFTVVETTSNSFALRWLVPYPMDNFLPGLLVKIEYQSEHENDTWQLADTASMIVHKNASFNLTGLKYANTAYDVRVYMKSSLAKGDNYWSKPAIKVIRTKPTVPGAAPKTDIGSFEINRESGRDVYVYWQHIDQYKRNGDKCGYKVIDIKENGIPVQLTPAEINNAYAKFEGISKGSYSFTIVSVNVVGRSVNSSKVYVPSEDEIPPQPISFTKIAFQNSTFELSWKPPVNSSGIKNYTIFWCKNGQDRPYQCTGLLDWIHVPKSETVKLLPVPNNSTYQFAISANSETASSGMVWASCTVIHNQGMSKMKNVWIKNTNATFVELVWNLDCSERIGTVKGFRVYYCPLSLPKSVQCEGEEKNDTVEDDPQVRSSYVVQNLKPYTTYRISIAVISSKLVEGPRSDFQFTTTTESAPEPVQNLTVSKVTNSSMVVSWIPPVITNGKIKYYMIFYNGRSEKVDDVNEITLNDLAPYVNYTVSVIACTVNCSNATSVVVQTKIGNPGVIESLKVSITNTSLAKVSWDPPLRPGGLLEMYTVKLAKERGATSPIYKNTSDTELEVQINCANEGSGQKYLFSVQALNRDGSTWYTGPWSTEGEGNCVSPESSGAPIVVIILCGIVAMAAGCFGAFYAARRVWGHYNEMRHVKVTLPPGLASVNVYCPTSYSY